MKRDLSPLDRERPRPRAPRSLGLRALAAAVLAASLASAAPARSDDDAAKGAQAPAEEKPADAPQPDTIVGHVSSELSLYSDSEAVTVATPTVAGSIENPLKGWSLGGRYLVDVVSAASVDIVATASRRWREVRHAGSFDGSVKIGPVSVAASGSLSSEPDYFAYAAGGSLGMDFAQKNVTALLGYAFGHDTIGRHRTTFDVFSRVVVSHAINGAVTVVVNRDTILSLVGDVAIERGDSSKPYRYIPMFAAQDVAKVPAGASIDLVNELRLPERPLEQLPLSRDRFALTGLFAHRFSASTIRVSERIYRDTWGLTATSTDARYILDLGSRVAIWPHARLHLQTPVAFWQRAYVASYTAGGKWDVPALRTGDRELGPLRGLTGGGGIQLKLGSEASPSTYTLNLQGEAIWTHYGDDLYLTNRASGLFVTSFDAVFE